MKTMLTTMLILLLAGSAIAQSGHAPALGLFFSDSEFTDANTNYDHTANTPFNAYLVLLDPGPYEILLSWEMRILLPSGDPLPASLAALSVTLADGYTNFGTDLDHRVNYASGTPLAVDDAGAVLATLELVSSTGDPLDLALGESSQPTFDDHHGPVLGFFVDPDDVSVRATTTGGGVADSPLGPYPTVATLSGAGITPVASTTLSGVKRLFD
jgi:hypothetical protein